MIVNLPWPDSTPEELARLVTAEEMEELFPNEDIENSNCLVTCEEIEAQITPFTPPVGTRDMVPYITRDIKLASLCAGVGHAELALAKHNYVPVAYVDIDQEAALTYSDFFPQVPRFGDVRQLEQAPGSFVRAIQSADVCFVGVP